MMSGMNRVLNLNMSVLRLSKSLSPRFLQTSVQSLNSSFSLSSKVSLKSDLESTCSSISKIMKNKQTLNQTQKRFLMTSSPRFQDLMTQVKVLRRKTGAGISLCLEALGKCENNQEKAIDYIQEVYGQNKVSDVVRSDQDVRPGLVGITVNAENNFVVISKVITHFKETN